MTKNRSLIIPAVIVGVLLVALAILYIAEPASSLPSFIPGHQSGSSHHHIKHGIAALAVGVACCTPCSPASASIWPTAARC